MCDNPASSARYRSVPTERIAVPFVSLANPDHAICILNPDVLESAKTARVLSREQGRARGSARARANRVRFREHLPSAVYRKTRDSGINVQCQMFLSVAFEGRETNELRNISR